MRLTFDMIEVYNVLEVVKNKFIFSKAISKPYQKLPGFTPALVAAEAEIGDISTTAKTNANRVLNDFIKSNVALF